ncbi:MAG: hypothetical protein JWM87_2680 [Candidatus Eremiobacteraeota bacterium]|nr:hypothetical protein [Candidatus Eremiobacteraeota bacterium]
MKLGVALAGMLTLLPLSSSPLVQLEPPRLVSSSHAGDVAIAVPLNDPHYPANMADDAGALAADVNAERAKHHLPALVRDDTLDRFAYAKAVEMAARGYFGHTDPNGVTFQDRLKAWHWPTSYAGENIAFDWDEPHAHAAFMNSPPHAQNVLDPNERKIGVAVVTVGRHETFFVENFSQ